jgi:glycine cleavage system H protein
MSFPSELRYTKEHEWVRVNDDGTATVGITEYAQRELGDIVFVELQGSGTELGADEPFGNVEAVKTVSELFMPVAGTIEEVNAVLESAPETVNSDPYGEGWMIRMRPADPSSIDALMSAEEYGSMVGA